MTQDLDKTLSSPLSFPLSKEQALAVAASQCAAEVSAAVATKLVSAPQWSDQLRSFHKQLQGEIYEFLKSV